jgi:membrane dipeptidase
MKKAIMTLVTAGVLLSTLTAGEERDLKAEARRIHAEAIVIDTHSDTPMRMRDPEWNFMERHDSGHMDYPRIREGGLDAVFLAVYMGKQNPEEPGIAVKKALLQIDHIRSAVERNPGELALALTANDIRRIAAEDRVAVLIGVEGGHIIDNSLDVLRCYHRLGVRYMTLTHSFHHDWADSSGIGDEVPGGKGGLTDFGRDVVREMNRLGMMVDISHVSDDTFWHVIETSEAPVLATHSGARAVCDHPRNLNDDMIKALAKNGGAVQVVFFPGFLDPDFTRKNEEAKKKRAPREAEIRERLKDDPDAMRRELRALRLEIPTEGTPLSVLIDHIEHIIRLVGPDHVGLGADWDGVWYLVEGLEDCSKVPAITYELLKRGHSEEVIKKILGGNLLRIMEEVERTAIRLQS